MDERLEHVVLVNEQDEEVGTAEKLAAHRSGALHRAFSVFLVDDEGRVLLQQRALGKYHSGGLWSNACCGHPRPGEDIRSAAIRRTREELGTEQWLEEQFVFRYRAEVGNGIIEHELDHVFIGTTGIPLRPDADEIMALRWCTIEELDTEIREAPERFTAWLPICWEAARALLRDHSAAR